MCEYINRYQYSIGRYSSKDGLAWLVTWKACWLVLVCTQPNILIHGMQSWISMQILNKMFSHVCDLFHVVLCVWGLCLNYGRNAFAISVYIKVLWMLIRVHKTLLELYLPQGIKSKYSWRRLEKYFILYIFLHMQRYEWSSMRNLGPAFL